MDQIVYTPTQFVHYIPSSFQNKNDANSQADKAIDFHPEIADCDEYISNSKIWSDFETRILLSFLADNFDCTAKISYNFSQELQLKLVIIELVLKLNLKSKHLDLNMKKKI